MIDLDSLSQEDLEQVLFALPSMVKLANQIKSFEKYNKIEYFQPFDYQRTFMNAGKHNKVRYLRAANRCGKTYGTAAEFSYHLTGLYPEDFQGERVKNSGHIYWAVGVTLDSVKNVLQKELIGTDNAVQVDDIGSGSIPRHCINLDNGFIRDGARVKSCVIKHKDGGTNTLKFYGSQDESIMMGQKVRGAWLDEEPPFRSKEIFGQVRTRLLNAAGEGEDGFLIYTATPENGPTELNQMFDDAQDPEHETYGELYLQNATMMDNPTLSKEQIEKYLLTIPEYQRDMRVLGIPFIGEGQIFSVDEMAITFDSLVPGNDWEVLGAVDWGVSKDPTVLMYGVRNPQTKQIYVIDEFYFDKDEHDRSPERVAEFILESQYCAVPVIIPHDKPQYATVMQRWGVNTSQAMLFKNPPEALLNVQLNSNNKSVREIDTGLHEMRYLFNQGLLKVAAKCWHWYKEKRGYYWVYNDTTKTSTPSKGNEHCIDASRYLVMSLIGNRGALWGDRMDMNKSQLTSYDTLQFNN
ncbi:TPA: terminase family protein [Klebsiella quasipneumoniae]|nr:terminase family protein [Klebsiella quasipneumoniae]